LKFEPSSSSWWRLCVPSLILRMFKRLNFADDLQLNFLYEYGNSYDKVKWWNPHVGHTLWYFSGVNIHLILLDLIFKSRNSRCRIQVWWFN
jgi:hypothetical protein